MKELGMAKIIATDIMSFPPGTIVQIGELELGDETADGADAEGGECIAYCRSSSGSSHEVDVSEDDYVLIHN